MAPCSARKQTVEGLVGAIAAAGHVYAWLGYQHDAHALAILSAGKPPRPIDVDEAGPITELSCAEVGDRVQHAGTSCELNSSDFDGFPTLSTDKLTIYFGGGPYEVGPCR